MLLIYGNGVFGHYNIIMFVSNRWLIFINIPMVFLKIWRFVFTGRNCSTVYDKKNYIIKYIIHIIGFGVCIHKQLLYSMPIMF